MNDPTTSAQPTPRTKRRDREKRWRRQFTQIRDERDVARERLRHLEQECARKEAEIRRLQEVWPDERYVITEVS